MYIRTRSITINNNKEKRDRKQKQPMEPVNRGNSTNKR